MKAKITITLLFAVLLAMFAVPAMADDDACTSALQAAVAAVTGDWSNPADVPADVALIDLGINVDNWDKFISFAEKSYFKATGENVAMDTGIDLPGDEQWMSIIDLPGDEQWMSIIDLPGDEQWMSAGS
jgi:hypothetical protein